MTSSPMAAATWQHKSVDRKVRNAFPRNEGAACGGRGRSRKRSELYNGLASYNNEFLNLLAAEYRAEEAEVLGRIETAADSPLSLEVAGHALFDLYPERRGDIFSDEVYRLVKAYDAIPVFSRPERSEDTQMNSNKSGSFLLSPSHKFSSNDVVLLTLQPAGSGDFFGAANLPTNKNAITVEARVLNTGPTYVDVAISGGSFEAAFGPAPNNAGASGKGDPNMRLRADRFFSNVPYTRMVAALGQITSLPEKPKKVETPSVSAASGAPGRGKERKQQQFNLNLDETIRDAILSTYGYNDPSSHAYKDPETCDLRNLGRKLARPPLPNSTQLTNEVLGYFQSNPYGIFKKFNGPQLSAIGAALTRRLTVIQGPPGTGKTTVAGSIAFGFVHQCRSLSSNAKVLACASSNVGADNLAEQILGLGLKVVRIGKASGVSESLWEYTLDAAIKKDSTAQKALADAAIATANLRKKHPGKKSRNTRVDLISERNKRETATTAVKASIQACNVAATKAMRKADVIVSTSVGAADSRLLSACGIMFDDDVDTRLKVSNQKGKRLSQFPNCDSKKSYSSQAGKRENAPDNLPPLTLPFVIVDEACQSVEPASLIPITSTSTCQSLVLLGDPCQLPPTVLSDLSGTGKSPLALSLMSRLASTLPQPVITTAQKDKTERDERYLLAKPTKQSVSMIRNRSRKNQRHIPYRKQFSGSLLLSVQYRMHPSISAFSSAIFYDGLLSTPYFMSASRPFPAALNSLFPINNTSIGVRFLHIGGRNNEQQGDLKSFTTAASIGPTSNKSYRNDAEALQIVSLLKNLLRAQKPQDGSMSIGVVSPYTSQISLLKSRMAADKEFRSLAKEYPSVIEVKSVDAYQGRERDLIIFSAVRSNHDSKIGFLTDWRRMNVALTRAKSALVVVGDLDTLKAGDKHWEAFGAWCQNMGCVLECES